MDLIPFDWGGQFGYMNKNGTMFWNEDWRSGRILFDGTWANYPRTFGPQIDSRFLIQNQNTNSNPNPNPYPDSSIVTSWFKYNQGDYFLDRFAMGANYIGQGRQVQFHGFKRSFAGGVFNPYENGTAQPIQQTYTTSYFSQKGQDNAGISVGYFNTLSGIADSTARGLIDNRITTANTFWSRTFGRFESTFSIDQFLQRYKASHSLSAFTGVRYLTRSKMYGGVTYTGLDSTIFSSGWEVNQRNTRIDSLKLVNWNRWNVAAAWRHLSLDFKLVSGGGETEPELYLAYERNVGKFSGLIYYDKKVTPRHIYFHFFGLRKFVFAQKTTMMTELNWQGKKNQLSLFSSMTNFERDQKLRKNVIIIPFASNSKNNPFLDDHMNIGFNYQTTLIPFLHLALEYNHQFTDNFLSDGIADKIHLKTKTQFPLFDGFMLLDASFSINGWLNREWNTTLHPIEMVPVDFYDEKDLLGAPVELDNIWFINGSITAHVSTFTIKYEWFNINEMILASLSSDEDNFFQIHPEMPRLGRQVILSIEWHFQD